MAVGEVRPGYELWRPNREKPEAATTKFVVTLLLLASAGVAFVITIGGWEILQGGSGMGIVCLLYVALYLLFAFYVFRWNRGVLPVASAMGVLLLIFCAVAAPSWFARDKSGFDSPLLPETLLGLLVVVLIPLQVLLIATAMIGFSQEWHVEEERPIGRGEDFGAGSDPPPEDRGQPQPA